MRGPAGTGKTTTMKEAVSAIEAGGHKVFTFAPSAEASRGTLRQEGFSNAQTVAHLLTNEALHPQLRGQVLWIDELVCSAPARCEESSSWQKSRIAE